MDLGRVKEVVKHVNTHSTNPLGIIGLESRYSRVGRKIARQMEGGKKDRYIDTQNRQIDIERKRLEGEKD